MSEVVTRERDALEEKRLIKEERVLFAEERGKVFLGFMELVSKNWRDVFNLDLAYSNGNAWSLFTTLWRAGTDLKGELVAIDVAAAFATMPEMRSLAGAKSFIEKAAKDKYLDEVKQKTGKPKYRLSPKLKEALDRCFLLSANDMVAMAERMPKNDTP